MNTYETLSQAVEDLKSKGYTNELELKPEGVACKSTNTELAPSDFEVDEMHRFEGESNPSDASVIYAISSDKHGLKGLLIDAFGTYADTFTAEMLEKLRYKPNL